MTIDEYLAPPKPKGGMKSIDDFLGEPTGDTAQPITLDAGPAMGPPAPLPQNAPGLAAQHVTPWRERWSLESAPTDISLRNTMVDPQLQLTPDVSPPPRNLISIGERKPNAQESEFFRSHPDVAGMATDDQMITTSPFSALSREEMDAVRLNERARVWMSQNKSPRFALTEAQRRDFADYGTDDDIRATIAARIFSGDPSAGDVTEEQRSWVTAHLEPIRPPELPAVRPMPGMLPGIMSAVSGALRAEEPPPTPPPPHDFMAGYGTNAPTIGAPPRGQQMTPPEPPSAWTRPIADPVFAGVAGLAKGSGRFWEGATNWVTAGQVDGNIDPILKAVLPELDRIREEYPNVYGTAFATGEGMQMALASLAGMGVAPKVPVPVVEALTGGGHAAVASKGDPVETAMVTALGGGLTLGAMGAGKVLEKAGPGLVRAAKGIVTGAKGGEKEFRISIPKPKPRIKISLKAMQEGQPQAGPEPSDELGKSIADELGVKYNGIQQASPGGRVPSLMLFTDPETKSTFAALDTEMASRRLTEMRESFKAARRPAPPRPVEGEEAKTILDRPLTQQERLELQRAAASTRAFEEALNVPGPDEATPRLGAPAPPAPKPTVSIKPSQGAPAAAHVPVETAPGKRRGFFPEYYDDAYDPVAKDDLDADLNEALGGSDLEAVRPGLRGKFTSGHGEYEGAVSRNTDIELPADMTKDEVEQVANIRAALFVQDAGTYFKPSAEGETTGYIISAPGVKFDKAGLEKLTKALGGKRSGLTAIDGGDQIVHLKFDDADHQTVYQVFEDAVRKAFGDEAAAGIRVAEHKFESGYFALGDDADGVRSFFAERPDLQERVVRLAEEKLAPIYEGHASSFDADPGAIKADYLARVRRAVGAELPEEPLSRAALERAFNLTPEQAKTVDILAREMGVENDFVLARGGKPTEEALFQVEDILTSNEPPSVKFKDKKMLGPVAKFLDKYVRGRKLFRKGVDQTSDDEVVRRLVEHMRGELGAWRGAKPDYVGFYDVDLPKANEALQAFAKSEYGRELKPEEVELFHVLSSLSSPGVTPTVDSRNGLLLLNRFITTGKLSGLGFKPGTVFKTGAPRLNVHGRPVANQISVKFATDSLEKLQRLVNQKGLKGAMDWIKDTHPADEIAEFLGVQAKHIKQHEYLSRTEGGRGAFAISDVKLGSYMLNRMGLPETVTKDMWFARTMARLFGEKLESGGVVVGTPDPLTKVGLRRRKLADQAIKQLADERGVSPAVIQQELWDMEKTVWERLGHKEPGATVTSGVERGKLALEKFKGEPDTLWQKYQQNVKGSAEFMADDAKAILRGFEGSDVSTAIHEIGHVVRRRILNRTVEPSKRMGITDAHLDTLEKWAGVKDGVWTREAEERFARGLELYLRDGKAPQENLRTVFESVRQWLRKIYTKVKGSDIDVPVSREMQGVYDAVMGRRTGIKKRSTGASTADDVAMNEGRARLVDQGMPREQAHSETTKLSVAGIDDIRANYDFEGLTPAETKAVETSAANAKVRGLDKEATSLANEILSGNRAPKDEEHMALFLRVIDLKKRGKELTADINAAVKAGDDAAVSRAQALREGVLDEIDLVTRAARQARTEAGRALSIGRVRLEDETLDFVSVANEVRAAKGRKLTVEEEARIAELVENYDRSQKDLADLQAKYDEAAARAEKAEAEKFVMETAKQERGQARTGARKKKILDERAEILKALNKLGVETADTLNMGANPEYLYHLGRLGVNYMKEGVLTLEEVVKKMMKTVPGLTEREALKALNAKNPEAQARARTATEKRISELKTQARLLDELADAEKGLFKDKGAHWTEKTTPEIKELRKKLSELRRQAYASGQNERRLAKAVKTINELQDQLTNMHRKVRKPKLGRVEPEEIRTAKEKLQLLRKTMKVEDDLSDLNEQIRTKDYKPVAERPKKRYPPDLERKMVEVAQRRKDIKRYREEAKPLGTRRRINEGVELMRTTMTLGDMSSTLRQNLMLVARQIFTDPKGLGVRFGQSLKATFSKVADQGIIESLKRDPQHFQRVKAGLELTEETGPLSGQEEYFRSKLIDYIPYLRDIVGGSERHFRSFSNLMRAAEFDRFLAANPNATEEELSILANAINTLSGRGDLGKFKAIAQELSYGIFAPRFAASRIQTVGMQPLWRARNHPRVRKEIAKDYAATVGLGMAVLTLAKVNGLEVGLDPRDSDFGKIRVGNTRIDIWGGFQQPARVIARVLAQGVDKIPSVDLPGKTDEEDPLELLYRFFSYKAAPAVSLAHGLWTGENMIGQKQEPTETIARSFIPMILQDVYEAGQDAGAGRAAAVAGLTFFGVGANTYERKSKAKKIFGIPTPKVQMPPQMVAP